MESPPIADWERLMRVSLGNAERARKYFCALVDEAETAAERIRAACAAGDAYAVRELVHALKGMALEVGAPRVAAAATALEAESDPAMLPGCADAVVHACGELRDELERL